jgi:host cell factor
MFVFGGWNGNEFFNDVFILDLEIMAWSKPNCTGNEEISGLNLIIIGPAPSPRKGQCSILIGTNLVVHGGFTFSEDHIKSNVGRIGSAL